MANLACTSCLYRQRAMAPQEELQCGDAGDAAPGPRGPGGSEAAAALRVPARFQPPAVNRPEPEIARSGAAGMTLELPGADSPGPERRPPDGGQWRSPAPTLRPPGQLFRWDILSLQRLQREMQLKEDLQHEGLWWDRRRDFHQRAQKPALFIRERLRRGCPGYDTCFSPATA
ncbi:hypothetical protein TREES_T100011522 [Tupaia chinensis]|uniref:Uncharacterized protein n=1 Tax=Tupaia chinensis TaxID=246437 RepID=L9L8Y7_TUPCH|nr:hypothetical protein TREES_T100011522 [Tupaia chinensis]